MSNDNKKEQVTKKLLKLIALGKSTNEAEAALAMEMARDISMKYLIDLSSLEGKGEDHDGSFERRFWESAITEDANVVFSILRDFFVVDTVLGSEDVEDERGFKYRANGFWFIGRKVNLDIADYVFDFLVEEIDRRWKVERKIAKKDGHSLNYRSFCWGVHEGIKTKLKESESKDTKQSTQYSLMIVSEKKLVEDFKHQQFPNLTRSRSRRTALDSKSYSTGVFNGKQININKGVGGSKGSLSLGSGR